MKKMLFILSLMVFSTSSNALLITGSAVVDNNNKMTIDYVFEANQIDVFSFDLFFDMDVFDNIQVTENPDPANWDALVLPSDPFLGEDGLINFLAFGAPIALNSSLFGFQITADFIGSMLPTSISQAFEVVDPVTFGPVSPAIAGFSADIQISNTDVTAPPTLLLFILSVFGLLVVRKFNALGEQQ